MDIFASSGATFSADLLTHAAQHAAVPMFVKDSGGRYVACNAAFCRLLGREEADLIGAGVADVAPGRLAETYARADRDLLASGGTQTYEASVVDAAGQTRRFRLYKAALPDAGTGTPAGIVGVMIDLSEEVALEAYLKRAELLAHFGTWSYRVDEDRAYWSDGTYAIHGMARDPAGRSLAEKVEAYLPEDRKTVRTCMSQAIATGRGYEYEARIARPDGAVREVYVQGEVETDPTGKVVALYGVIHDLTDQRRAERDLAAHQAELQRRLRERRALYALSDLLAEPKRSERVLLESVAQQIAPGLRQPDLVFVRITTDRVGTLVSAGGEEEASCAAAPLILDGSTGIGRLEVCRRQQAGRGDLAFDEDEAAFVGEIARLISGALGRHRAARALQDQQRQLKQALLATIRSLAATLEKRDPYTAGHQNRVADLAEAIGRDLGLAPDRLEGLRLGALVHDIGKVQVPSEILTFPGRLSEEQFALMKTHCQAGYDILKDVDLPWPVAEMVHQHHERLDGSGYPQGLVGEAIILEARIIAVADVVESMTTHRPYRAALGLEVALAEIGKGRGVGFDAAVVDACVALAARGALNSLLPAAE